MARRLSMPSVLVLHAVAHILSCLCSRYNNPERNPGLAGDLARLPQEFLHWKTFANRVALEAGQQQRSNARRHCTAGGSSGEREEERHGVAGC